MAFPSSGARGSLLGHSRPQLELLLSEMGEKSYRASQIMRWFYHQKIDDFQRMTDLSKSLRSCLDEALEVRRSPVRSIAKARDGVLKWIVEVEGGGAVEAVLIPDRGRNTLCVSSQVGCALNCSFCATGKQGYAGNLSTADIVSQVWHATDHLAGAEGSGSELTNVVFMGMGEPLLNLDAVLPAVSILMDDMAFGLSKRRVTISTAGVVPGIRRLCGRTDASLAISLHAPNNELRSELVPMNRKYPIEDLLDACRSYLSTLGDRRVLTFEYTLLAGINDSVPLASELADLVGGLRAKVNLIPFNPFPGAAYRRPGPEAVLAFQNTLRRRGIMATCRATRGDQINAACGQLVGEFQDRTRRRQRQMHACRADSVLSVEWGDRPGWAPNAAVVEAGDVRA
ncbi:MAG: 23S rRNA (adenine(2503)-C(2))-methyltransferase RlmN [Pseudomonadales bacterium]|nr:23S rRNA (adenine(2503)-C(2))-methyltransferase RlmN [Pseudomonadales bacterium]